MKHEKGERTEQIDRQIGRQADKPRQGGGGVGEDQGEFSVCRIFQSKLYIEHRVQL